MLVYIYKNLYKHCDGLNQVCLQCNTLDHCQHQKTNWHRQEDFCP